MKNTETTIIVEHQDFGVGRIDAITFDGDGPIIGVFWEHGGFGLDEMPHYKKHRVDELEFIHVRHNQTIFQN